MFITIPAGTRVEVCRDAQQRSWLAHVTRKEITGLKIGEEQGEMIVSYGGWLIKYAEP